MRFKLLSGIHREGGKTYSAKDPQNCVVESEQDLVALHGAERWRRIDGGAESYEEIPAEEDEFAAETEPVDETGEPLEAADLDAMTVDQLRQHAQINNVDISGLSRKADILEAIRAAEGEG